MTQNISSPAPALLEVIKWACNMRATVEPGYLVTDGETIGNDSVRVYVVEAKK